MAKQTKAQAAKAQAAKAKSIKAKATIKAKQQKAKDFLAPIAKEINHRLKQAEKMESDGLNHRLAASIQAARAKEQCKANQINFKSWCDAHLTMTYENIRKLARIGASDDPKLALDDMRAKAVIAQAKQREKAKAEKAAAKAAKPSRGNLGRVQGSKPKQTDNSVPLDALEALEPSMRKETLSSAAAIDGLKLVTNEQASLFDQDNVSILVTCFKALSKAGKKQFIQRIGDIEGFSVSDRPKPKAKPKKDSVKAGDDSLADIPDFLRRGKAKPASAKPKAKKAKASKRKAK